MNIEKAIVKSEREGIYRLGGASAIILGISYIIITALYIQVGASPSGGEAWLTYLAGHANAWWVIAFLSVLTDALFLPVAFSLYQALKEINRNATMIGAGLIGLFAILDLAVTWPNYASLITLSGNYAAATDSAQRAAYAAAGNYAFAVLTSHLLSVYTILVPSLGILIVSLVMFKGNFGKISAYSGVATGILGVISVVGSYFISALGTVAIITSVLTIIWVLFVGYGLTRPRGKTWQ